MTTRRQFLKGAAAGAALLGAGTERKGRRDRAKPGGATKPNVVLIVADDLDRYVYRRMPGMRAEMDAKGAVFSNFHVATSVCVPSRASILRGQYAHNTGVHENKSGAAAFLELDGKPWRRG